MFIGIINIHVLSAVFKWNMLNPTLDVRNLLQKLYKLFSINYHTLKYCKKINYVNNNNNKWINKKNIECYRHTLVYLTINTNKDLTINKFHSISRYTTLCTTSLECVTNRSTIRFQRYKVSTVIVTLVETRGHWKRSSIGKGAFNRGLIDQLLSATY